MITFLAVCVLALALPVLLRLLRALFVLHLWAVVLFLPAGLLLRFGGNEDMAVFALVTATWGTLLAGWRIRRWWAARREERTRPRPQGRAPQFRRPHRERLA